MSAVVDVPAGLEQLLPERSAAALTPSDLENLIECWRLIGTLESNVDIKRMAFDRMRQLIAKRAPVAPGVGGRK